MCCSAVYEALIPVAVRSTAYICGTLIDGIMGSNPAEVLAVLLRLLCVV